MIVAEKAKMRGFRKVMSEALIDHEIKVNGVGLVLTELLGLRVATERQMVESETKSSRRTKGQEAFPDLWIVDKENPKAIEVELRQKSEARYKEIFYRYYRMAGYDGGMVLYLTGWPKGPELLWKLAKQWDRPFVYVASLQRFREQRGLCTFTGYRGNGYYFPGQKEELVLDPAPVSPLEPEAPKAGGERSVAAEA